jgi:carbon monoxide dehydrogenase subunit G
MIEFELGALVDRPLQEVFDFLSNPLNLPKWQAMVGSIEQATPGALGVGSKYNVHAEMLGRKLDGVMEITAYEPPAKFGFTNQAGPMQVTVLMTLKPAGTGTKITLHAQGNPGGVFKLAEGPLSHQVQSQMEANLARLKALLEAAA